ncbi:MAG TPA: trypsin-like peptidase domain-containing protein [Phycisphaerales bacterium]|nr:trypsin-like peptidase domain-containing protein [Phycisphaerales bacterium]
METRIGGVIAAVLAGLLVLAPAAVGQGANGSADADATQEDFRFARSLSRVFKTVAEQREASVVHITQLRRVRPTDWWGRPIGPAQTVPSGLGSGVIIDPEGIVVTNNHVIADAEKLKVKLSDNTEFEAELIGRDELTDLAVLRIRPGERRSGAAAFRAAPFANSDAVEVGEWVVAIGSPFGLDKSVTAGIISAKGRTVTPRETGISYEDYIQTDAAINPGNSGGPLLNLSGEIVGINSAIASRTGGYDGIGFAIPSNTVRAVVENILKNGRVVRGYLGVELSAVATDDGMSRPGALVGRVSEGSPAARAGLREGDIITRFQDTPVTDDRRLRTAIALTPPGSEVTVVVQRDGKETAKRVTLGDRRTAMGGEVVEALGVTVMAITDEQAQRIGLRRLRGVVVTAVDTDTPAHGRLEPGDIIVAVNDEGIRTPEDLEGAVGAGDLDRGIRLNIIRDNMRGYVDVQR